ncbi:MAG TPA: hypothetical protein VF407_23755 [Polyangiaceae bacterium]
MKSFSSSTSKLTSRNATLSLSGALFAVAVAACSSSSPSASPGGSGNGSAPDCATACDHLGDVCASASVSGCNSSCDQLTADMRECLVGANDCNSAAACVQGSGNGGDADGGTKNDGGAKADSGPAPSAACVEDGTKCSTDDDCSDVYKCDCTDGSNTYPQPSDGSKCESGTCSQKAQCLSACQSVGGSSNGLADVEYGNCG